MEGKPPSKETLGEIEPWEAGVVWGACPEWVRTDGGGGEQLKRREGDRGGNSGGQAGKQAGRAGGNGQQPSPRPREGGQRHRLP